VKGKVLVIHTKANGEIAESATGKDKAELDKLRKQSREIDSWDSPYLAVVSVMVLREGWDVRNVTTIVGCGRFRHRRTSCPNRQSVAGCAACSSGATSRNK
jgi:type III restriction enzyme